MKVTPVNKKFGKFSPGESFDLPDKTAKIFVKLGKLAKVEDQPAMMYATRMLQAAAGDAVGYRYTPASANAIAVDEGPTNAPYGYKADGTPRQRPGRPAKSE